MGNSNGTMPVQLSPVTYSLKVRLGEPTLTAYRAVNNTGRDMDGIAVHTLFAMGGLDGVRVNKYVDLTQCFCFQSQHYPAHQTVNLPLSFTVTPDLPPDVHTITFSYTLFPTQNAPRAS
jgi:cytochrome c oxidase assembly protein subunit 11